MRCSAEGFGQCSSYQMKSRPLRVGGVGEGQGLGRIEGANKRIEQLAESRVQPRKHTETRHAEHGGNLLCKETHKHTSSYFFISHQPASLSSKSHTRSTEAGALRTITKQNTVTEGSDKDLQQIKDDAKNKDNGFGFHVTCGST